MRISVVAILPEATPQPVRNPTAAQSSVRGPNGKVEGTTFDAVTNHLCYSFHARALPERVLRSTA